MTFRKLLTVQNKNIQNYLVPKLELECGDVLEDVELAYTTYGNYQILGTMRYSFSCINRKPFIIWQI